MVARIVLVHDDDAFRFLVEEALLSRGHDVTVFANALAAWDAVTWSNTSALVTRVRFHTDAPHGVALAKWALVNNPSLHVVFTAAPDMAEYTDGIGILLRTPVAPCEVARTVTAIIAAKKGAD